MKKILAFFVALSMVFALSGNAMALFEEAHLNLAVYNTALDQEYLYDLGVIGTDFSLSDQNLTLETGITTTGMLNANAYSWAVEGQFGPYGANHHVFATVDGVTDPGTTGFAGSTTFVSNGVNVWAADWVEGVVHDASATSSFVDAFGDNGSYAGFNLSQSDGIINIGTLGAVDFVDMNLSYYVINPDTFQFDLAENATLRLTATGDAILNPVPVPGALVLICTGLLGALGIKRRKA